MQKMSFNLFFSSAIKWAVSMMSKYLWVLGFGLLASSSTMAGMNNAKLYLGADLGKNAYQWSTDEVTFKSSATGYRVFAGIPLNDTFRIETAWVNQGKGNDSLTDSIDLGQGLLANATADISTEVSGLQFSTLGAYSIHSNINLLGNARLYIWRAKIKSTLKQTITQNGAVVDATQEQLSENDSGLEFILGLGVEYLCNSQVSLRTGYDLNRTDDVEANQLYLGIVYKIKPGPP